MKILFVSSEVVPFAKTGGLADVSYALPIALKKKKQHIVVMLPLYKQIDLKKYKIKIVTQDIPVVFPDRTEYFSLYEGKINKSIPVYFISNRDYFYRDFLYSTPKGDYPDNAQRFIFFSKAVLEASKVVGFQPDIIHCNDWQTALIPLFLKTFYSKDGFFYRTSTVFTIHNLAYQGIFSVSVFSLIGLGWTSFTHEKLEYYGKVNFMKAGIILSDIVNTVSENYASQIQTPEFGHGLDGVLKTRQNQLYGILNGIDYRQWNPQRDRYIPYRYNKGCLEKKEMCKKVFLSQQNLLYKEQKPLIGFVSRLAEQKGVDILLNAVPQLVELGFQLIILGKGNEPIEKRFYEIERNHSSSVRVNITFDERIAHNIYAASDFFIMPSRFEPCGLGQLISFVYATVPVVNPTGGLYDTVKEFNPVDREGNGFLMKSYSSDALIDALKKAKNVYNNKSQWRALQLNLLEQDYSWEKSASKYIELYKTVIK